MPRCTRRHILLQRAAPLDVIHRSFNSTEVPRAQSSFRDLLPTFTHRAMFGHRLLRAVLAPRHAGAQCRLRNDSAAREA